MSNLLFLLTAVHTVGCPQPRLVNWTEVWTSQDNRTYIGTLERCKVHFGSSCPCVKTFIKKKERTYYVVCASKSSKDTIATRVERRFYFTTAPVEIEEQQSGLSGSKSATGQRCSGTCPYQPSLTGGGN